MGLPNMPLRVPYYEAGQKTLHLTIFILLVESGSDPKSAQMNSRTRLKRKEVDDILGGDEAWGNIITGQSSSDIFILVCQLSALQCHVPNVNIPQHITWNCRSGLQMNQ